MNRSFEELSLAILYPVTKDFAVNHIQSLLLISDTWLLEALELFPDVNIGDVIHSSLFCINWKVSIELNGACIEEPIWMTRIFSSADLFSNNTFCFGFGSLIFSDSCCLGVINWQKLSLAISVISLGMKQSKWVFFTLQFFVRTGALHVIKWRITCLDRLISFDFGYRVDTCVSLDFYS